MSVRVIAALLVLSGPATALAEGRSHVLMDLLSRVPSGAIESEPGDWSQLWFADIGAAAGALPALPEPEAELVSRFGPYARVNAPAELGMAVGPGFDGEWETLIGFSPLEVEAALGFNAWPDTPLLVQLDPAALGHVGSALLAQGYVEQSRNGVGAWARGDEDFELDRATYNMANPFGGDMGQSSRVALDGTLLVETAGWEALGVVLGSEDPKGHPDLPALAAALDSPDWGEARLLQAAVLPHQFDLATGRGGMPPWRLGMLADLGTGTETVALALFSYGSRAEAAAAAKHIAKTWDAPAAATNMEVFLSQMGEPMDLEAYEAPPPQPSFRECTGAEAITGVAGEGPFVAWVALRGVPEGDGRRIRNRAFMALWTGVLDRNLTLFGPL